jgi:hypothetical protein
MSLQNTNYKELKTGSRSSLVGKSETKMTKEQISAYIENAVFIGFTRKEAITQLHSIGIYLSK